MKVKTTERGWPGHYICADKCLFRRNTLVEYGDIRIVVSTVGNMRRWEQYKSVLETIGYQRHYETMVFHAEFDGNYWDADVSREVEFEGEWAIEGVEADTDNRANAMHEAVVAEISKRLESGEKIKSFNDD